MAQIAMRHPDVEGTALMPEGAREFYESLGWELAGEQPAVPVDTDAVPLERPQRNDKTDLWRDYAVARGMSQEQADAMSRDELVAHFDSIDQTLEA